MESISVFDIFKIGVGPSSSHTMGPWRAAERFLKECRALGVFGRIERIGVDLYGSLAKTGKGHGTDVAVLLGLSGEDPETCETATIDDRVAAIREAGRLRLGGERGIEFDDPRDVRFHMKESLPGHPNGLRFSADVGGGVGGAGGEKIERTYYSVGGGFVVEDGKSEAGASAAALPYPIQCGADLLHHCETTGWNIPKVVMANERTWRSEAQVRAGLGRIWRTMQECVHRGCHTDGVLPGGLGVVRRAAELNRRLLDERVVAGQGLGGWMYAVEHSTSEFEMVMKWVSTFALAVNEENAAFGRVVTAPTNGAAGVIPAVMMYYRLFKQSNAERILDFMLTAGELGSIFKKGATISAAMGGCQAEIGVSSAMAAGGLAQVLGGSPGQVLMAAEIAMEHHLGMTCDPVGGLVQIPCIERNTMGAMKAITATAIALESDPGKARVSLDGVIKTMWETAKDMGSKYKETAEGGLAVNVSVGVSEC